MDHDRDHGGAVLAPLAGTAAGRRGLAVLLVATFLTWGGFFMAIPLIAVHYVDGLGWAAASVGLVLGVASSCSRAPPPSAARSRTGSARSR